MKYSILGEEKICQIYKDTEKALDKTVGHIVQLLDREKQTVATAESCTGGLLSQLITSVSGASRVFELGICTYAERMKTKFLGVPAELIAGKGVVSAEVAMAMAHGLRQQSDAALCLSVTGIAGPGGGTKQKPVGLVFIAVSGPRGTMVKENHFSGARTEIKRQTTDTALEMTRAYLEQLKREQA